MCIISLSYIIFPHLAFLLNCVSHSWQFTLSNLHVHSAFCSCHVDKKCEIKAMKLIVQAYICSYCT